MIFLLRDFLGVRKDEFVNRIPQLTLGEYEVDGEVVDDRIYIVFESSGFEFLFEKNDSDEFVLDSVFLSRSEYLQDNLPSLLDVPIHFGLGRNEVRRVLGEPYDESVFGERTALGPVPPWDKFYTEDRNSLHFQYNFDTLSVDKITLEKNE